MKTIHRRAAAAILALLITLALLPGCSVGEEKTMPQKGTGDISATEAFDTLADRMFRHYATSDSLTLNYLLTYPGNYDIQPPEPRFADYSLQGMEHEAEYCQSRLKELAGIDRAALDGERQLTYDILVDQMKRSSALADNGFLAYGELLSPTVGTQVTLPVLLAEYRIVQLFDADRYVKLLRTLPAAVDNIIAFEQTKKEKGLFMAKTAADDVIAQIGEFIEKPQENLLIKTFNDKVDALKKTDKATKEEVKADNRKVVLEVVIPAFERLRNALKKLNEGNGRTGGVSSLPKGQEYYRLLAQGSAGSARGVEEMEGMLEKAMEQSVGSQKKLLEKNPKLATQMVNPKLPQGDPDEILRTLRQKIQEDFPALDGTDYRLKYVHPSLEKYASPAFYLVPTIDDKSDNIIYINRGRAGQGGPLFPMLAHEGFPGHLYQMVYFKSLGRAPIRSALDFSAHSEGWASYVERLSYKWGGLDDDLADILIENSVYFLALNAVVDIGVNYRGWDKATLAGYLEKHGLGDEKTVSEMYNSVVAEPCNILKYAMGYLEFKELRGKAEAALGGRFDAKALHHFLLETGPAPFPVIDARLDGWLAGQTEAGKEKAAA
ncbi:MAG: DUF885 domain-containing protein [Clostridiales Family XIII bacterium]|jgi:uncharacterized protein (DUF885 family)|nr:DUF885 domain-containing protein [Clostridiales Family XIII bacterium]